jgi:predicted metal-dependent hydrolase
MIKKKPETDLFYNLDLHGNFFVIFKRRLRVRRRRSGGLVEYRKFKHQAHSFIKEKILEINRFYNFSFNRVCVKNHKSRWGSCSQKGNLNFNYKIIHLPLELAEYIVVHELCHLKELNHSERFWALVARAIPDYKARRRQLKAVFV